MGKPFKAWKIALPFPTLPLPSPLPNAYSSIYLTNIDGCKWNGWLLKAMSKENSGFNLCVALHGKSNVSIHDVHSNLPFTSTNSLRSSVTHAVWSIKKTTKLEKQVFNSKTQPPLSSTSGLTWAALDDALMNLTWELHSCPFGNWYEFTPKFRKENPLSLSSQLPINSSII